MSELRPEDPDYPGRVRRIREQLDEGLAVYVDHCEFVTSKKMVLIRATALTGPIPASYRDYLLVTWIYAGSMWYPLNVYPNWGYIAEKFNIDKWPGDAKSIAAFLWNINQIGSGAPLVTAGEMA